MYPFPCKPYRALPTASRLQAARTIWTDLYPFPPQNYTIYRYISQEGSLPFPAQGVGEGLRFCTHPIVHHPEMQHFRCEEVFWFGFAGLFHISVIIVAFAVVVTPKVWGGLHPICLGGKESKLNFSFRTHRLFLFQIRGICRALCSHHPHINPWQWECTFALSLLISSSSRGWRQLLTWQSCSPHTAQTHPLKNNLPSQLFFPCAKLQVSFLPLLRLKQG